MTTTDEPTSGPASAQIIYREETEEEHAARIQQYWWRQEEAKRNAWRKEPRRWLRLLKGVWAAFSNIWKPVPLPQETVERLERMMRPRVNGPSPPPPGRYRSGL